MTTTEVLEKMLKGWTKDQWCKGVLARGKSGREVDPTGRAAQQWCLLGRLDMAYKSQIRFDPNPYHTLVAALPDTENGHLVTFNNASSTTFSDIKALLKRAIKIAKRQQEAAEEE